MNERLTHDANQVWYGSMFMNTNSISYNSQWTFLECTRTSHKLFDINTEKEIFKLYFCTIITHEGMHAGKEHLNVYSELITNAWNEKGRTNMYCICIWKAYGGLTLSALDSELNSLDSNPRWGHCVEFLCKTLYSHSASLHT